MKTKLILMALLLAGCVTPTPAPVVQDTLQSSVSVDAKAVAGYSARVDSVFRSNANSSAKGRITLPPATTTDSFRFKWTLCVEQVAGVDAACGTRVTGWTKRVVTPPVDTTTPPPVSALFPNAPTDASWKLIWDSLWTKPANKYSTRFGGQDNGSHLMLPSDDTTNYRFEVDRSAPWPEGKYHSLRLPEGLEGGNAPTFVGSWNWAPTPPLAWTREIAPKGDLYFGFYIRHRGSNGKPYVLRNLGGQKMYYLSDAFVNESVRPSFAHIFIRKWGDTLTGGLASFEPQHREPCSSEGHYTETPDVIGGDDKWHLIEYIILANERTATTFKSNGKTRIFVDGKQVHYDETTTVYCAGEQNSTMNWTSMNPIYGGGRQPVPYDLYLDYGPIKVMGR